MDMKKNLENYQTHSSRVSFLKYKYGLYMKRAICFSLFAGTEILQSLLFVNSVLSRHDYTVYTAITHLRNIYLVSKMPSPIFLSIGYTKNAITDDDSHYMFIDDI